MYNRPSLNKKLLIYLLFLTFTVFFTGCWGYPYPSISTIPTPSITEIMVQPETMDLEMLILLLLQIQP